MPKSKPRRKIAIRLSIKILSTLLGIFLFATTASAELKRLHYNNPGLIVDLGVGLWAFPLPLDYDEDGDLDLLVGCPDAPYNGVYFFENPGGDQKMPVFKPAVRLGDAPRYMRVSYVEGEPRILVPGHEYIDFRQRGFDRVFPIYPAIGHQPVDIRSSINIHDNDIRANEWHYLDYDGDGDQDLIVGVGDWYGYGWDNAYDAQGYWRNDRLHGYVYLLRNVGSDDHPRYAPKEKIRAGEGVVDVYGWPSPNFADFDGDGDLDLLCGEFIDSFTYFENIGSRTTPRYASGQRLEYRGKVIRMDMPMIVPAAIDWDHDGDVDLIVGQEDGRVAFLEHSGRIVNGAPRFLPPRFFQQEAAYVKFGASTTPVSIDWDGDGDADILSAMNGRIAWLENLSGGDSPRWAAPVYLKADGRVFRLMAGENGSIQGPAEAKWGDVVLSAADWDGDGLADLVVNSNTGEVIWLRNAGTPQQPRLEAARHIEVEWPGKPPKPRWNWWDPAGRQLVTQWRTTPVAVDFTKDGLTDLVMLDHEGYLALYERKERNGRLILLPPQRIFIDEDGLPIRLNPRSAGGSGRRKIAVTDWDGDGRQDILVDADNADWWRNCETRDGRIVLKRVGPLAKKSLAKHATSPAVMDWNRDGKPDLLLGAEDGHLYVLAHDEAIAYTTEEKTARPPQSPPRQGRLAQPGFVSEEFIFTKAPFQQCHASTIVETNAGLVAAWFAGTEEAENDVGIWLSRKRGLDWDEPRLVADGVQHSRKRYPCWNPVLFQPQGGPLMLFYKVGPDETEWWGKVMLSYDRGRRWREERRLPEDILGPIKNKPVQLADGAILSPSSVEYFKNPPDTDKEVWRVHLERSDDMGKTWEIIGPLDHGGFNAIQPSILVYPDGRMQILCRSQSAGRILEAWSDDMGAHWSPLAPTELPNPDAGTDAVMLRDGRALLVYNHTRQGRDFLNVAVSPDGRSWYAALVLEQQTGEYSYPAVIQADDGLVHVTYTWRRQRIKHVVLDPTQFKLQKIENGKWPKKE